MSRKSQHTFIETDKDRVKELVHERTMWLNGVQPTTKGKKRINRSVVAHNVAYAAQQANKSDPFAGRRARSHMLNGHLTPQDVQAGSY